MIVDKNHMDLYMAAQTDPSDPFLDPDKVKIDDRSRAQLFTMLYKLSRQFWYYNPQGQKEGDWSAFFESDLTSLLAIISEEHKQREFTEILSLINGTKELQGEQCARFLLQSLHLVVATAVKLNNYYLTISRSYYQHPFQVYLNDMIAGTLSAALKDIWLLYAGALAENKAPQALREAYQKLQSLSVIWGIDVAVDDKSRPWPPTEELSEQGILNIICEGKPDKTQDRRWLVESYRRFYDAYQLVILKAGTCFRFTLEAGNTQPHIALIFAFLKLFQHQQNHTNGLVEKYLSFYYRDILRFGQEPARPDTAFVLFTLNKDIDTLRLDKGTLLSAGETEEGDPITFATEEAVLLSSAVLTQLKVAKVEKSGLKVGSIEGFQKPQLDETTGQYKTFSLTEPTNVPPAPVPPKTVGFAISSPCLVLYGGVRTLTISLKLDLRKAKNFISEMLNNGQLSLTTASGWYLLLNTSFQSILVDEGTWKGSTDGKSILINIALPLATPSIVSYEEEVHGPGYDTQWPILRCEFNVAIDPESELAFQGIIVSGGVTNLKDLNLYTPDGEVIMEATPLAPFGSEPVNESEFIVGAYEPFIKPLTKASITLDWFNLLSPGRFQSYYKTYIDYWNREAKRELDLTKVHKAINDCINAIQEEINKRKSENDISAGSEIRDAEKKLKKLSTDATACIVSPKKDHNQCVLTYANEAWNIITNLITTLDVSFKVICSAWDGKPQVEDTIIPMPNWSKRANYKVQLSTLNQSHWGPKTKPLTHGLFPDKTDKGSYVFSPLVGKDNRFKPDLLLANPPVLDQNATSGFFKFSLTAPCDPFANQLYLQVFNWIVMKNGGNVAKNVGNPLCPQLPIHDLPNMPYIPQVSQISMNYHFAQKAGVDNHNQLYWLLEDEKGVLSIKEDQCDKVEPEKTNDFDRLENEKKEGQSILLLGFEDLEKGAVLSLYLGITESQTSSGKQPTIEVQTEDEKHNKTWKNLTILSNTTHNWQEEGIIRIKVDHRPVSGYSGEEDGLYWLKIVFEIGWDIKLTMIGTNGLKVKRHLTSNSQQEMQVIPASAITELLDNVPAIDTVYQPFDSFGLQSKESTPEFRHRVAHRLRYKDRGASVLACQRLILDHFKEVFLVDIKLSPQNPNRPKVEVFIIPWVDGQTNPQKHKPKAKPALLAAVRSFLQNKISSLVSLEVKCSGFEEVKVKAEVTFLESSEEGDLAEKLKARVKDYLSPWIKNQPESRNAKNLDIDKLGVFIENLPYVKSLTALAVCLGVSPPVYKRTGIFWPSAPNMILDPKVTLSIPKSKEVVY